MRSQPKVRSVAGQVFLWQLVAWVLIVAAALTALILQARNYGTHDAKDRTRVAAIALSHSPGMVQALDSGNPTAVLQPLAEETRTSAGFDYVIVLSPAGIRYTGPDPSLIGKPIYGPYKEAFGFPWTSRTAICRLSTGSAGTGSTSSRCPGSGWRWSSATSSATACTPRPPWAGCGRLCTTSPRSTCLPTS
ncbi:hypothetical protein P3T36_004226 [Kitasatospora sp. MAP12-15]|nr:hypothetical protein [Kitasatospora sp. MAP12-44]